MCPPGPAVKSLLQAHAHRDSSRRPGPWERPLGCQEGPCPGVAVPRCLQVWAGQLHKARQASPGWPSPYSEEVEVPSAARGRRAGSEARGWLGGLASAPSRSPSSHCPSLVQPEMATCSPLPSRRVPGVSSRWPSAHIPSPSPGPLPQPSSPGALSEAHCPARLYLLGVGGLPEACPSGCMLRPCRAAWRLSSMPPLTVPSRAGPPLAPTLDPTAFKVWPPPPPPPPAQASGAGPSGPQCAAASSRALLATCHLQLLGLRLSSRGSSSERVHGRSAAWTCPAVSPGREEPRLRNTRVYPMSS